MHFVKKFLIIIIPPLFFIGLWWGLRETKLQHEKQGQFGPIVKAHLVKGFISPETVKLWSKKANVTLEVIWANNLRELLDGYENPAIDFGVVPSFHAHEGHTKDVMVSLPSQKFESIISKTFVDFLFLSHPEQDTVLVPAAWDVQTLFCPLRIVLAEKLPSTLEVQKISGQKIRIAQNASELISILLRLNKIQQEWITPEQSDLLKSEVTEMKTQFEIVNEMVVNSQPSHCWFDSLSKAGLYKAFARPLWTAEPQSLWVYYFGLKNKAKSEEFVQLMDAYNSDEVQNSIKNTSTIFSTLKQSSFGESRDSRLLEKIPLSQVRVLKGRPEGETIWDKIIEMALENQPVDSADEGGSHEGPGDD